MLVYFFLICIIVFIYYRINSENASQNGNNNERKYLFFICSIIVFLAAFRSDDVGADTPGYRYDYENLIFFPTFQSLIDRYTISYIGYFGLSKLFSLAKLPVQVWFGFVEAFYLFALMKLVNKFSKDKIFSLLVFTTIGLFSFSLAGLKQTLSMSLMMLSFVYFYEKKYWLTALLVFVTYYTHPAGLIFLAVFPLYYVRQTKWFIPLIILLCGLIYTYSFAFMESMVQIIGNEKYEEYLVKDSGYTYVTFIFYSVITLISFSIFKNYFREEPETSQLFLGVSVLGCGLQLLAGVSPSLFRLALSYTPFMMILIPNSVYYVSSKNKKLLRLFMMGCIIFYFLFTSRNFPYSFMF